MDLRVERVSKRFGGTAAPVAALASVDLAIRSGELMALLGPSGSGKTTLLRILAGLERPDEGRVLFDGRDAGAMTPPERQVGFVFQNYALFRYKTVFDNIAFALQARPRGLRPSSRAIRDRVDSLLALVQLEGLGGRYPSQLSGGQRQRVALARALAAGPRVLLLDEPFGALDAKVRKDLRRWLKRLHQEVPVTSVFVTHDQEEALELADRVAVMNLGRIEQVGPPGEVYDRPATAFVYDFLGDANRIEAMVRGGVAVAGGGALAASAEGMADGPALIFARPHGVRLEPAPDGPARVAAVLTLGATARIDLTLPGVTLEAAVDRERLAALGLASGVRCAVRLEGARVFPAG